MPRANQPCLSDPSSCLFATSMDQCLFSLWFREFFLSSQGGKFTWKIYLITERGFTRLLLCFKQCRLREGLLGIDGDSIFSGSRRMRRRNRYIEIQIKPFLQEMLREFYRWYEEITKKLSLGIGGDAPGYATLLELFATVQMAVS